MRAGGKTWWGKELIASLEECMDSGRLQRGRSYSRPHRLVKFHIKANGEITARAKGNKNPYFGIYRTPYYNVRIKLKPVPTTKWPGILKKLGQNANWLSHLIIGEVPRTIDRAFEGSPVRLLPESHTELNTKCSCPDWASPCKHVAGSLYHVSRLLDHDPVLLFQLRGMSRKRLFNALAKTRIGRALDDSKFGGDDPASQAPTPRVPTVGEETADMAPSDLKSFWLRRTVDVPVAKPGQAPALSVLPMRRAGDYPGFWEKDNSFLEANSELYQRIAKALPEDSKKRDHPTGLF